MPYLIYSLKTGKFFLYYPTTYEPPPLLMRPYIKGFYECTCISGALAISALIASCGDSTLNRHFFPKWSPSLPCKKTLFILIPYVFTLAMGTGIYLLFYSAIYRLAFVSSIMYYRSDAQIHRCRNIPLCETSSLFLPQRLLCRFY